MGGAGGGVGGGLSAAPRPAVGVAPPRGPGGGLPGGPKAGGGVAPAPVPPSKSMQNLSLGADGGANGAAAAGDLRPASSGKEGKEKPGKEKPGKQKPGKADKEKKKRNFLGIKKSIG